jgi:hypothetical protein
MRFKFYRALLIACALGAIAPLEVTEARKTETTQKQEEWIRSEESGIPFWFASNTTEPPPGSPCGRKIHILVEAANFSRENLLKIFQGISRRYESPRFLEIVAFSDRENLWKDAHSHKLTWCILFRDKKAQKEFYARIYPAKSGYYRAYYRRYSREDLRYSPDPDKEELIFVPIPAK